MATSRRQVAESNLAGVLVVFLRSSLVGSAVPIRPFRAPPGSSLHGRKCRSPSDQLASVKGTIQTSKLPVQPIADADFGEDELRASRGGFDFGAELGHGDAKVVPFVNLVGAPDFFQ